MNMRVEIVSPNPKAITPPKLQAGDKVRFVSPASTPDKDEVYQRAAILESWGLTVDFGEHIFRKEAFLAGTDDERLADFNAALRDPTVRTIFATRGGRDPIALPTASTSRRHEETRSSSLASATSRCCILACRNTVGWSVSMGRSWPRKMVLSET